MKKYGVSSSWVKLILDTLGESGMDPHQLCKVSGINYDDTLQPFGKIDGSSFKKLWDNAREISNNDAIGLCMANAKFTGIIGAASHGFLLSSSFKEAVSQINAYAGYFSSALHFDASESKFGHLIKISLTNDFDNIEQEFIDSVIAYFQFLIKYTFKGEVSPLKIYLARKSTRTPSVYQNILGCPVEFEQPFNGILFDTDILKNSLSIDDKFQANILQQIFIPMNKKESSENISEKIRVHIQNHSLINSDINLENISQAFKTSKSTIKRRLKDEGFTFRQILDDVRKDLAKSYLENESLSIQEVTYRLGYKEPSPFFRAFRRWYHCTPTQFLNRT